MKFYILSATLCLMVFWTSSIVGSPIKGRKDNSHYCCKIDSKNETIEIRTRTVTYATTSVIQHIVGYEQCGSISDLIKTSTKPSLKKITPPSLMCKPIYQNITQTNIEYRVETYAVPIIIDYCPPQHRICCEGFIMINKDCVPVDTDDALLQQLIQLGLLGK